jgi:hypothetical protein
MLMSKIYAHFQNICVCPKYMRVSKIYAPKLCGIVKLLRHIIYDRNKADIEISAPIKIYASNVCVHQKTLNRRPNSYYLGSAESPTSDFC